MPRNGTDRQKSRWISLTQLKSRTIVRWGCKRTHLEIVVDKKDKRWVKFGLHTVTIKVYNNDFNVAKNLLVEVEPEEIDVEEEFEEESERVPFGDPMDSMDVYASTISPRQILIGLI